MTTVYCDCDDCYNNDDGRCALDTISMSGRMTGGGWFTLCDDYQEINREDFEPQKVSDNGWVNLAEDLIPILDELDEAGRSDKE